jgi:hypothetical protein
MRLRLPRLRMRRVFLPVCATGLLLVLAGLAWVLSREPYVQTQRPPDGSALRLEGAGYGTQHRFVTGQLWQWLFAPVLPLHLQCREMERFTTSVDLLGLLFSRESRTPGLPMRARVEAFDEHGCRIGKGNGKLRFDPALALPGTGRGPSRAFSHAVMEAFPRRGPQIHLRLYAEGRPQPAAEFDVSNPVKDELFTDWRPKPLPLTDQRDNVAVSLTGLTAGLTWDGLRAAGDPSLAPSMQTYEDLVRWRRLAGMPLLQPSDTTWTRADFRVVWRGQECGDWLPESLSLSDATGNRVGFSTAGWASEDGVLRAIQPHGGDFSLLFPTPLCVQEAAWKLQTRLTYTGLQDDFGTADLRWSVKNIPLPNKETILPGRASATRKGIRLHLQDFSGSQAVLPDDPDYHVERPLVRVDVAPPEGELVQLALQAKDDQGREVGCSSRGSSSTDEPEQRWYWELDVKPDAKQVHFTFAGWKSRSAEFLVHPATGFQSASARHLP